MRLSLKLSLVFLSTAVCAAGATYVWVGTLTEESVRAIDAAEAESHVSALRKVVDYDAHTQLRGALDYATWSDAVDFVQGKGVTAFLAALTDASAASLRFHEVLYADVHLVTVRYKAFDASHHAIGPGGEAGPEVRGSLAEFARSPIPLEGRVVRAWWKGSPSLLTFAPVRRAVDDPVVHGVHLMTRRLDASLGKDLTALLSFPVSFEPTDVPPAGAPEGARRERTPSAPPLGQARIGATRDTQSVEIPLLSNDGASLGVFRFEIPRTAALEARHALDRLVLAVVSVLGMAYLGLFLFVRRNFVRRVAAVASDVRRYGGGEIPAPRAEDAMGSAPGSKDELDELDAAVREAFLTLSRSEAARRNAEARLESSARLAALGEMAGGVAHEVNNPLTIILGKISMLGHLPPEAPGYLEARAKLLAGLEATALRIARVVRSLRLIARDGGADPTEDVDASELCSEVFDLCRERFANEGVELDFDCVPARITFPCRRSEVAQVLLALLANALDAVVIATSRKVRLEVLAIEESVVFAVWDSGFGVEAVAAERLFEPFHTTKPVGKGTGLGLSVSKAVALAHGGDLSYERREGYTRFVLTLPRRRRDWPRPPLRRDAPSSTASGEGDGRRCSRTSA